eukprot:XP_014784856.1 PREDICTED: general transcription factor II-I repeat domain-containing protein 2A-like [Octopus bimaculoides]
MAKNEGFIAHIKRETKDPSEQISFHCILHQQNLCAKSAILNDTLHKVTSIVNYIRANAAKHRQFRSMLMMDDEVIKCRLPYHSKVRWLSQGKVLVKIVSLRKQIIVFFKGNKEHFPQFTKVMSENEDISESFEEYKSVLDSLVEEYNKKFSDFEKHNLTLKLAFQPHLVDLPKIPEELQMELIEMSEDNILKSQFDNRDDSIEILKKGDKISSPSLTCTPTDFLLFYNILLRIHILVLDANQEFTENTVDR